MATETMTVLFTDMVGSTEQRARLGDVAADALLREHDEIVRVVAERHDGRVDKGTGDGAMLTFGSAANAVRAAVAIQQTIDARNRRADAPIALRVGLSLGDVAVDEGVNGLAVHEAARVCALANGGEILISDVVRVVAGSRLDSPELVAHGTHDLKGIAVPVTVWSVPWTPSEVLDSQRELPTRLIAARSPNFVGRGDERRRLAEVWKLVVGGACRLMFLSGEPGIGKTTLAAVFAADVHDQNGLVVYGRSDEELGVPYQPWIEALSKLVAHAPDAVLAAHVADRGAHLARLVPQLAARVGVEVPTTVDRDSERFVLYGTVTDLLVRLSAQQPVLIVLDDLHWADRASVQLLRHVVTSDEPMRVGVLGTFRDSDIGVDHPVTELLAAMHRQGGAERITLGGLTDLDLLALLETIAGHEMDDQGVALRDALLAETAGNPFFVAEILLHLAESGAIFQRDGRWMADADLRAVGLPVSIREVVGRRLATLGPDTERVLALASVIGRDFDIRLLASIAHIDEDSVIDLCDAAVAAAVLATTDRTDQYTFAHALIEHTLYDGLSPARRARAHSAIAENLETLLGDAPGERTAELAYHWAAAVEPADNTRAVHYAHLAGDRALEQLAPDEAVRWFTQALELSNRALHPDNRQRAELLVGLGDAQRQSGIPAYRETLLEAFRLADHVDDTDLVVSAVLANNRGFVSNIGGADYERLAAIDRALERVGNTATVARAKLLALAATERRHAGELAERVAMAEEAVADARLIGDPAALAFAVQTTFSSIDHPSTLAVRQSWVDEVLQITDDLDAAMQFWQLHAAWITALEQGDGAGIDAHLLHAAEVAQRIPHTTIRWTLGFHQAWAKGLRGDLDEYERLAEASLAFGTENGEPDAFTVYAAQLVNIREHQGRVHELIPLMQQALVETPALRAYRAALVYANVRAGALGEAKRMLAEDLADGFSMPADLAWSIGIVFWIDAAVHLKAVEAAALLRAQILPYHDQIVTTSGTTFEPALCHYIAQLDHLVGNFDDAEHWFSEALQIHGRVRSPILIARTQAAWAAMLADRNQRDDHYRARAMAQAAIDAAVTGGYGYIESDARAILDQLA